MPPPLTALLRSRRALIGIGVGVGALVIGGVAAFATASPPPPEPTPTATPSPSPSPTPRPTPTRSPRPTATATPTPSPTPAARCPLDGMPLSEGVQLAETALAVQVENHPEARPGRNLNNADLIYETTVEGDTTRFTGIFLCDETAGMTGPVRSARYYNLDLWRDLHVLTVGFGASPGAVQMFLDAGMPYPNGIEGIWPWYQRYGSRAAPHNLYVDLETLREDLTRSTALAALAARVDDIRPPFTFSDDPELPSNGRAVDEIEMWTNSFWSFAFSWDDELEAYRRSDSGVDVTDEATGKPLAPRSLVVQRVTQETVYGDPDPGGFPRRLQHLVGDGSGTLYTDGRAYELNWERPEADASTIWTFADTGDPVEMPPGQVWIEILPVEASLFER